MCDKRLKSEEDILLSLLAGEVLLVKILNKGLKDDIGSVLEVKNGNILIEYLGEEQWYRISDSNVVIVRSSTH